MSYITDAVIWVDSYDKDLLAAIESPLACDVERHQSFCQLETKYAGGVKVFCSKVYAAAFNYVSGSELEAWFKALPWRGARATLRWDTEGESGGLVTIGAYAADEQYEWGVK